MSLGAGPMSKAGGRLQVRILGCGSSGGVPRVGNDWGACDPAEPRNRRSRGSALFRWWGPGAAEPTLALIDTSPDLRDQLLAARVDRLDAAFITHEHADQCHGIDDLRGLVIRHRKRIPVHMNQVTAHIMMDRFGYCFEGSKGYPAILDRVVDVAPGQVVRVAGPGGDMELLTLDLDHGGVRSVGFRVGIFAYCNDVVRLPPATMAALRGLDTLVVDALRHTPSPSHATVAEALGWIVELKPRRAILTNLAHDLDYASLRAELPPGVEPAFDGLELEIPPSA